MARVIILFGLGALNIGLLWLLCVIHGQDHRYRFLIAAGLLTSMIVLALSLWLMIGPSAPPDGRYTPSTYRGGVIVDGMIDPAPIGNP